MFPSPIGELHFSIINGRMYAPALAVSVPYRGATFLNGKKSNAYDEIGKKFPSPIGELHFSMRSL